MACGGSNKSEFREGKWGFGYENQRNHQAAAIVGILDRNEVRKRERNPGILLRWGQIKFV